MSMKKQILGVVDDWIYCTQDDLCHYFDPSRREPFTENEIRCTLEVPGLKPDDIHVVVENNVLTVSGEKKYEQATGEEARGTYHQERRYGRFDRSFILPRNVEATRVNASYDNGVLAIVLPKTEESKPRRVQISTGSSAQQIATGD